MGDEGGKVVGWWGGGVVKGQQAFELKICSNSRKVGLMGKAEAYVISFDPFFKTRYIFTAILKINLKIIFYN